MKNSDLTLPVLRFLELNNYEAVRWATLKSGARADGTGLHPQMLTQFRLVYIRPIIEQLCNRRESGNDLRGSTKVCQQQLEHKSVFPLFVNLPGHGRLSRAGILVMAVFLSCLFFAFAGAGAVRARVL